MKKTIVMSTLFLVMVAVASIGMAATNVRIAANIGDVHQLDVVLSKVVGKTWSTVSDLTGVGMDFGTLTKDPTYNILVSNAYFVVDGFVTSNKTGWTITHSRTDFVKTGGTDTLNSHVNVTFVKVDNTTAAETQLSSGYVSYQNSNSKIINQADLSNAHLRIYYGLASGSGDASGVTVITPTQASGLYTGTVTLTLSP